MSLKHQRLAIKEYTNEEQLFLYIFGENTRFFFSIFITKREIKPTFSCII
jgi:hypothetical protein